MRSSPRPGSRAPGARPDHIEHHEDVCYDVEGGTSAPNLAAAVHRSGRKGILLTESPRDARATVHALVDLLPDRELAEAARLLSALREEDPVRRATLIALLDDEPFTDEDRAAVAEAEAGYRRGEWVTNTELKRELGL